MEKHESGGGDCADPPEAEAAPRIPLKVVLTRELPRSAGARVAACSRLTVRWSAVSRRPAAGRLLDRGGQRATFTLIAQVGQHSVVLVGPLGQQRQGLGMGAQRGGVVLAAGAHTRGP